MTDRPENPNAKSDQTESTYYEVIWGIYCGDNHGVHTESNFSGLDSAPHKDANLGQFRMRLKRLAAPGAKWAGIVGL